ncbi:MAG TPA: hypothetical protein VMU81_27985 [Acetobacteraceae bacterium]|nr:hypothetical protein [Acetobacteraceae bacterium]
MSNLLDLLALVVNVISIFAAVSFAASAATGAVVDGLQLRARHLLRGLKALLFDASFTGLARALYNTETINPLGTGAIQAEAEVRPDTIEISPDRFATAILQILHIDQYANLVNDPNVYEKMDVPDLPEDERVNRAKRNAKLAIDWLVAPDVRPQVERIVDNLITLNRANLINMKKAATEWFQTGMGSVTQRFTRQVRFSNFIVAFIIAVVLDLKPIPLGGFGAELALKPTTPGGTAMAASIPYLIAGFQWLVVALSALPGAEFWFVLLKRFTSK